MHFEQCSVVLFRYLFRRIHVQYSGFRLQSVISELKCTLRYDNCGVVSHRVSDSRKTLTADVVCRLPNIVDCAGLADENTPDIREKLELLIGG